MRGAETLAIAAALLFPAVTRSQAPRTAAAFEIASIKPCRNGAGAARGGRKGGGGSGSPGTLHLVCQTLSDLIRRAYLVYPDGQPFPLNRAGSPQLRISAHVLNAPFKGAPGWADSDRYTIDAKPETPQTAEMMHGPMLQALLHDRFNLRLHPESKDVPAYALTVAKGGPKLKPAQNGMCLSETQFRAKLEAGERMGPGPGGALVCGLFWGTGQWIQGYHVTMEDLADELSRAMDRDVVDRTGLRDEFDIRMELDTRSAEPGADAAGNPADEPPPSVFAEVARLGLRLEPAKANATLLVIDHVERPSEN